MNSVFRLLIAIGCSISTVSGPVFAQEPGGEPPPAAPERMSTAQVNQLFDAMVVMQAQRALALSENQYAQFLAKLRVLQDTRRRNQRERARLINTLQQMTNPRHPEKNAPESEVRLRLNALQELEARSAAELRRAYNGLDEVLSPLQQARFRVFEEDIERRKLQLIGRARQMNPNRPPPQRRPPGR